MEVIQVNTLAHTHSNTADRMCGVLNLIIALNYDSGYLFSCWYNIYRCWVSHGERNIERIFHKTQHVVCNLLKHLMQQLQRNTEVSQSWDLLCNTTAKYILYVSDLQCKTITPPSIWFVGYYGISLWNKKGFWPLWHLVLQETELLDAFCAGLMLQHLAPCCPQIWYVLTHTSGV